MKRQWEVKERQHRTQPLVRLPGLAADGVDAQDDLWPGLGSSGQKLRLQRDRTRVSVQLQQGFSIGIAAVGHDSPAVAARQIH